MKPVQLLSGIYHLDANHFTCHNYPIIFFSSTSTLLPPIFILPPLFNHRTLIHLPTSSSVAQAFCALVSPPLSYHRTLDHQYSTANLPLLLTPCSFKPFDAFGGHTCLHRQFCIFTLRMAFCPSLRGTVGGSFKRTMPHTRDAAEPHFSQNGFGPSGEGVLKILSVGSTGVSPLGSG